jgi:hypothetical protein
MNAIASRSALFVALSALAVAGCTFNPAPPGSKLPPLGGGGTGGMSKPPPVSGVNTACEGLACRQSTCRMGNCVQPACPAGSPTTLSGKVFDPAGKVPLYNVDVYVPNKPLTPFTDGPSCDTCGTNLSGEPIVRAVTDAAGNFKLGDGSIDVPSGANVPLVFQVGRWRREVTIANVAACADTPLSVDPNLTRLPRNQTEGHLPKIALTTGNADALECLLRKIGIDDSEFTTEAGTGRVNFFAGQGGTNAFDAAHGGAMFTPVAPWWNDLANLSKYDMILHSCEGTENPTNKNMQARQALQMYADMGGRVFASHWHNYWFEEGPAPWPGIANFDHQDDLPIPFTATIDTTFPKGMALADWLVNVGGSTTPGELVIQGAQHTINTVGTGQRWIYSNNPQSVQYLDQTTPMNSPAACGRVVLSDIHVSTGGATMNEDSSGPMKPYPTGCVTTDLSPQEKTLEFMIFDLSSCIVVVQ